MRRIFLLGSCAFLLPGCATTSFAPPQVNVHQAMDGNSLSPRCKLTTTAGSNQRVIRDGATYIAISPISPNVDGAQTLIANYLDSYRCAMRLAADGRQAFEVPSFLALIATTTAMALGAGTDVAVLGGAGNSVFTNGKNYYAPAEQTEILNDSFEALACIQTESVGIDPFKIKAVAAMQKAARGNSGPIVEVTAERQYFNMVFSALISVERAAAQRLSRRGSFDAAGIAAQYEALAKKVEEAKNAKDAEPTPTPDPNVVNLLGLNSAIAMALGKNSQLDLNLMHPKLETCVLLAKS